MRLLFLFLILLAVDSQRLFRRPLFRSRGRFPGRTRSSPSPDIPNPAKHRSLGRAVLDGAARGSAAAVADYVTRGLVDHIARDDYDLYPDYIEDYRPGDWIE